MGDSKALRVVKVKRLALLAETDSLDRLFIVRENRRAPQQQASLGP